MEKKLYKQPAVVIESVMYAVQALCTSNVVDNNGQPITDPD